VLRQNEERLSNEQHTARECNIVTCHMACEITIRQAQAACILAIIVVSRLIVRSGNAKSTDKKKEHFHSERKPIKTIWRVVNVSLVTLSVRQGYASLAPEQLRHVKPRCGLLQRYSSDPTLVRSVYRLLFGPAVQRRQAAPSIV